MAMWATNGKRGLIPGTVGITITVIEYYAGTNTYQKVSSAAYRLDGVPQPATPHRSAESAPVSMVRPFIVAGLTERTPQRGGRRRSSASDGDDR
ncbi:hypothetical protein Caci_8550 [Catenulispora acidiphila DSM 44928]|uniref:Uncharacterized protein n=1 Tax=Catenulispora acidiphila (strain DSM 44928 / JCM 14897 / NBRC 102108 / NRRL B-24433 / ID139908) TaxID=479433 RepID=C7PYP8_CATAD|nr:hypothetical protein [Catenulispora acidiphila]ACU77370.1 hypothetical protein Caci_8550 [Catenulispora acidiphila DSM 44928]